MCLCANVYSFDTLNKKAKLIQTKILLRIRLKPECCNISLFISSQGDTIKHIQLTLFCFMRNTPNLKIEIK